jgi:transcriptional regulator
MKRSTRTQIDELRREVANYALKGWTQAAIAWQMKTPAATVSMACTGTPTDVATTS